MPDAVLALSREMRSRVSRPDRDDLQTLWDKRNVLLIIWNQKDMRIWHWPTSCRDALIRMCGFCVTHLKMDMSRPPPIAVESCYVEPVTGIERRDIAVQYHPRDVTEPMRSRGGKRVLPQEAPVYPCICHLLRNGVTTTLSDACQWCLKDIMHPIQTRAPLTLR